MNQVNKKVLQVINENKISTKDIFTRSKYWEKPFKTDEKGKATQEINEDYRNLKIYSQWKWWQPNYKFLPTPDKFVEIKKAFLENTWSNLENIPHYIIRNRNNQLIIILQNRGQYDFADPRIVLFYGRNSLSEDTKQRNEKADRKGEEYPAMYWITSWDYINNKSLLVQITAQKEPVWANYGDMMNSRGAAKISRSQFNNDHLNKEGQIIKNQTEHWPSDEDWNEQSTHNCPACDNCYDFCGDLRNKRAVPVGYIQPQIVRTWQPSFKLLYSYVEQNLLTATNSSNQVSLVNITDDLCVRCENKSTTCEHEYKTICIVPTNIRLREWKDKSQSEALLTESSIPSLLFIVDREHDINDKSPYEPLATAKPKRYPSSQDEYLWEELPKAYHEQPHLLNHSSAQFYFQKKLLFTANLRYLQVKRKSPGWALGYQIIIKSSISGILYCFQSGAIFYKWELKVKGSITNSTLLNQMIGSVMGNFVASMKELAGGALSSAVSAIPYAGPFLGKLFGKDKEGKRKAALKLADVLTGDKYGDMMGVKTKEPKQNQDKPEQEAQTERLKKSTAKAIERIVEPAIFYSGTVDFSYDFWEFANRSVANPFMIRFEHSEVLYNNLLNNNNTSPIQNIQCRFSKFKQCVKVGEWQGEVDLMYDIDNTLTNACGAGTFFYDDLEQLFQPWRPKYKGLQSFTYGDTFNTGVAPGQEDCDVIPGEAKKDEAVSEDTVCQYDNRIIFIDKPYIKNSKGEDVLPPLLQKTPGWTGNEWPCNPSGWTAGPFILPQDTYTYNWKIWTGKPNSGTHEAKSEVAVTFTHPSGGGKGKGPGVVILTLESGGEDQIIYKFKIERIQAEQEKIYEGKEYNEPEWDDNNTQFNSNIGETDPEALEKLKEFDQEYEQKEFEDKEKDLKESSGETEKDFEKELEKQKEREKEREKEKELERELEKEKEKDREKELDQEREKQREREKQAEREKKQRDQQWEKDKKERDRKEREAKVREKERIKKEQKEKQKQKDKEKKERE